MKYVVFDTETTGLPSKNHTDYSTARLIQLAWLVCEDQQVLSKKSYIIKDSSYKSSPEALSIHKITEENRQENGVDAKIVINRFLIDVMKVDCLIAHGMNFDLNVLIHECKIRKISLAQMISKLKVCCTKSSELYKNKRMNLMQTVLSIDPNYVNETSLQAHDALYDSYMCKYLFEHSKKIPMISMREFVGLYL